jgi:6-phosphogluconate dehydrogenase
LHDPEAFRYNIDVTEVAEMWRRGSVVGSRPLDLTAHSLHRDADPNQFGGRVSDSGEGQ